MTAYKWIAVAIPAAFLILVFARLCWNAAGEWKKYRAAR